MTAIFLYPLPICIIGLHFALKRFYVADSEVVIVSRVNERVCAGRPDSGDPGLLKNRRRGNGVGASPAADDDMRPEIFYETCRSIKRIRSVGFIVAYASSTGMTFPFKVTLGTVHGPGLSLAFSSVALCVARSRGSKTRSLSYQACIFVIDLVLPQLP